MFQPGLAAAEERLRAGDWVHIFPEGTRSRDGKMGPVRKGVGRLVAACSEADPLIVPFVHSGMEEVLPKGSLLPKTSKEVCSKCCLCCGRVVFVLQRIVTS